MSDDYWNDSADWCDEHAIHREVCGCQFSDPRGPLWPRLLNRSQLAQLPAPDPMIDDTIDRRTVAMLVGAWGTGKTFVALDWSLSIATGKAWQARETRQGSVVYVAAEGAYGLNERVRTWEVAWSQQVDDDAFHVVPLAVEVANSGVRHLISVCKEIQPSLVVIDTIARCAVGLDENTAKDAGLFVRGLDRIRDSLNGGTVLAVHHTGKDGKTPRGSSAIEGAMDTVYNLEGDSRAMRLHRSKRKEGPVEDTLNLRLERIPETDGVVVSRGRVDTTPNLDRLMSAFLSAFSESGASKAELRAAADLPPSSFYRAVNHALRDGLLVNDGTEQRPFYHLGRDQQ